MNLGTLKTGSGETISNLFGYIQKYINESDFKLREVLGLIKEIILMVKLRY